MSHKLQADKELNTAVKMILQAYNADILEKFKAWELIREAVTEWEKKTAPSEK